MTTFAEYLSFITTYIVSYFIVWVISKLKKSVSNKRLILFEKKSKEIDCSDFGFTPIATNYRLKKSYFRAEALKKCYNITIPEECVSELQELNFLKVKLSDDNEFEDYHDKILKAFNNFGSKKKRKIIKREYVKVAKTFICDIEKGKLRFNKYLYGVSDVVKEKDFCKLFLYESDYFTFKVTVGLYNLLRKKNNCFQQHCNYCYKSISKLVPFLNSIGVGGFIILDRGFGDELVFGFRSKANCQSGGYWHFSFDETFTHDDKTSENGMPSVEGCMLRAIEEELGISEEERKICGVRDNVRLLNAGIISTTGDDNRFEFEVCGFGYVKFDNKYTFEDFCLGYRFAKDAEIETQTLDFINIKKDLDSFLETAKKQNEISPEAYYLAKNIKLLYDLKILGDSYWQ